MKTNIIILLYYTLLLFLMSCQPKTMTKTDETSMVDSSFYYVHEDISDPFLDTIFQAPDQAINLKKEIYPPPVQKSKFKEIEGFRIQIFAGLDSLNALSSRSQAADLVSDSVYLLADKGLLKVQVGDYPYRYQADTMRDKFRKNGFPGAWIILRTILIPADTSDTDETLPSMESKPIQEPLRKATGAGTFKIQIIATGSESRAGEIINEITGQLNLSAFSEKSGNLYKVFVGYFKEEQEAREALKKIREGGYKDAWLVY
jgi:hypothetical protein